MGLRVNPSTPLWTAVLLMAASVPAPAQFGPPRVAGALGVLAFEGTRGESGVGLMGAAQITLATTPTRQLAVEFGFHTLTPVDQACLLGVPAACSPASPASPVWHARVLGSSRFNRAVPLYVTLGLGAYGPVGPADQPHSRVLGLDAGLGLRLSSHAALEARYLNLRTTRFVGWAVPISVVVGL